MKRGNTSALLLTLAAWLLLVPACGDGFRRTTPASEASGPKLELLSTRVVKSSRSYVRLHGEVRNIGKDALTSLFAVAELRDKDGNLVSTDGAVIEFLPLEPGATSPFEIIIKDDSAVAGYQMRFKTALGGEVDYTDKRPPEPSPSPQRKKGGR